MLPNRRCRLYRLTYESKAMLSRMSKARSAALQDILKTARRRNILHGVSGVLLYNQNSFFQILEGNKKEVEEIFSSIFCDIRHTDIRVSERKFVESRIFHSWSMAYLELPADTNFPECTIQDLPAMLLDNPSGEVRREIGVH